MMVKSPPKRICWGVSPAGLLETRLEDDVQPVFLALHRILLAVGFGVEGGLVEGLGDQRPGILRLAGQPHDSDQDQRQSLHRAGSGLGKTGWGERSEARQPPREWRDSPRL